MKVSKGMVSTPYPSIVYFVPLELNIKFTSSNSTFLIQHSKCRRSFVRREWRGVR